MPRNGVPRDGVPTDRLPRFAVVVLISALAGMAGAGTADARRRHQIDATPFSHAPCSVLDNKPCTPTFCSVFNREPCIPEIYYPYGQDLLLTIESAPSKKEQEKYQKPEHTLDTISDLFAALRSCWLPPPSQSAREGMQMSVRFSFKKSGEMIAPPRLTYATPGVPADVRSAYFEAINLSLRACVPLDFSSGLGGALAGRPIAIRYVDNRRLSKAETP